MNETTQGNIAVIATRLPYTDRRALSQAWFSALHLAADAPAAAAPPQPIGVATAAASAPRRAGVPDAAAAAAPAAGARAVAAQRAPATAIADVPAHRARPRPLTRSEFARARSYAPFRTSLTLGVEGERVALLIRREGDTLYVVALCRPAVADLVRKALAGADRDLRARGETVRSRVETIPEGVVA